MSVEFSRHEQWSSLSFPLPGCLPNPGIELKFPELQADCLPSEPPGKPRDSSLNVRVSLGGWEPTLPEARLRNEQGTKGDETGKEKRLWLLYQNQQWMEKSSKLLV